MNTVCKEHEWVAVEDRLPDTDMRVRWRCVDGIEDFGYFYKKTEDFTTFDPNSLKEITHWKPYFEKPEPKEDNKWEDIGDEFYNSLDIEKIVSNDRLPTFFKWLRENYNAPEKK